ncbi:3-phosphoshikimate 1-carboxyvinyltransferase [Flavobacterium sp.]|uniref:3-phosphoshikimate 1-carboxyvinyltransferase n=1 Tax=Flavobacterium sp. TaxID=239 RepID=UPI003D0CD0A1
MNLKLLRSSVVSPLEARGLSISGSKSETNRLLLLQALYPELSIENASNSDDSEVMSEVLRVFKDKAETLREESPSFGGVGEAFDIHHAGTAMRFLTAYFAIQEGEEVVLTGSSRMKERPIKILVDALRQLGADIEYVEKEGYPPLRIKGKKITQNKVAISANVSSQYISALLLIAPKLDNGLELTLEGEITSIPYIKMTLSLLEEVGVATSFNGNVIRVNSKFKIQNSNVIVESDWSSASYWYSIIALSEIGTQITLSSYKQNSLQGDAVLAEIYKNFGVETDFINRRILLRKVKNLKPETLNLELNTSPDIAQTIAVTCLGLGIDCELTGLHTLKIKETDRLQALKNELEKFGASVTIDNESLRLVCSSPPLEGLGEAVSISTYQDHRMAMAFAPLALKADLIIEEAEVVSKSYPDFWNDLKQIGFKIQEI